MKLGGWVFRAQASEVDESVLAGEAPQEYVLRLAQAKAQKVAQQFQGDAVILAADTTVVESGSILGKPENPAQAVAMLRRLRNRTHQVYTAVVALRVADDLLLSDICVTQVPMRNYSDEEIAAYVASGDPFDKAGAYAIQHQAFHPVENLYGCYANVMGLPLCHLSRLLMRLGIPSEVNVPIVCQKALAFRCEVYPRILAGEL